MQHIAGSFSLVLCLVLSSGCAGLMSSEMRDGETARSGETGGTVRLLVASSAAPVMRDTVFDGGLETVAPALGVGGYVGITDRIELNGSAWTSAVFAAPVTFFRTADAGLRGGVRFMATSRSWRHNVALGVSGWWHGGINLIARFDDDLRYYGTAYGIDPSLTWSFRFSDPDGEDRPVLRSIYLGSRLSFAYADYTFGYSGGDTAASTTVREYHGAFRTVAPFAGVRTTTDGFLEIGATLITHPESGRLHWIPALGIGWKPGR